jgi:hypothetical protein
MMRKQHSYLGRHQPKPLDAKAAKRAGWWEYGILVIAEEDPRLSWPELELVRQLDTELYGQRRAPPDA